ncbi:MAG: DUF4126 family protein [Actinobacteria bacterium]|nr:MAG: DUF4126 family protein [Actinomycetota bacterium]
MDLFLDITLGLGLAVAAGVRPFLPALLAGALAGANLGVDFDHTGYAFLESAAFLIAVGAAYVLVLAGEAALGAERLENGPLGAALAGLSLGLGALLFAGALGQHGDAAWPGLIGGLGAAALAQAAVRQVLPGARRRLSDAAARRALPVYLDGVALLTAAAAVLAPPVSLLALAALARLVLAGRRRQGERYAGLRILR